MPVKTSEAVNRARFVPAYKQRRIDRERKQRAVSRFADLAAVLAEGEPWTMDAATLQSKLRGSVQPASFAPCERSSA